VNKQLLVDCELCNGCGLCELACAVSKTGQYQPFRSRIRVWRQEAKGMFIPAVCVHCVEPPCQVACLMNVVDKHPVTGLTTRRVEGCIGCRACQVACPFDAACYDEVDEVVVNCDHCGGNPECVKYCPTGALQYGELEVTTGSRRRSEFSKWLGG